jgi:hypothetical protein
MVTEPLSASTVTGKPDAMVVAKSIVVTVAPVVVVADGPAVVVSVPPSALQAGRTSSTARSTELLLI